MNHRLPSAEDEQEEVLQDLEEKLPLSSRPLLPFPQGRRKEAKNGLEIIRSTLALVLRQHIMNWPRETKCVISTPLTSHPHMYAIAKIFIFFKKNSKHFSWKPESPASECQRGIIFNVVLMDNR